MSRRIGPEIVAGDVLALVELVYEAASDDSLWTPFLEGLMGRTGDEAVAQVGFDTRSRLMGHLAPHLQRAFLLRSRLTALREERRVRVDALDALPSALLLLHANGRPVLVNRAARRILRARDGLCLDSDGLRAATPILTSRLRELLRRTALLHAGATPDGGDVLRLPRPSGALPLVVLATPLPPSSLPPGGGGAAVAVFLRDPANEPVATTARLERLYGLTAAEARLAVRLAAGEGLDEAADALGVARETVRSQLKAIFGKTDTRRQGELLRKLALDSALLPEADPSA